MKHAILLFRCPDKKGIVARISDYILRNEGNIIQADQHTTDPEGGQFFLRIEFCLESEGASITSFRKGLEEIACELNASWKLYDVGVPLRMGILVSKEGHCLADLLYRYHSGELNLVIPFVLSNHPDNEA